MPSYLATAAANNLATQDAAMTRVNAVARLLPQSPDQFAAPVEFSDNPQSGIRNPQSLSDLHTDDISQRRAAIDDQKKFIQARLGIIQPKDAGLAAVVLAGPKERKELLQNMALLEHEEDNLLREHQINSVAAARAAHENLSRQLHIQSSTGLSKVLNGIADIKEPIGSDEHTAAVMKILGSSDPDIAAARGTAGFEKILAPYAQQAKKSAEIAARIKEAANEPADQYYSAEALLKDNPGAEYRQDPKTGGYYVALGGGSSGTRGRQDKLTSIVEGDLAKIGVRPDEFTARTNVRRGHLKNGEFSNKYSGAEKGDHVAFDVDGTTYTMPVEQFTRADKAHPIVAPPSSAATVKMIAPDGAEKNVPADQIEHYKKLGAKLAQ